MPPYTFRWPHEATEVYVTGTFDNWAKTEKLTKVGHGFEKSVDLPKVDDKIYYKFVVDGNWTTDHLAPSERDHEGNVNNILTPDHFISSVAPPSTTASLAGNVPREITTGGSTSLPGGFPVTPITEFPTGNESTFSVNPLPATSGGANPVSLAPGEKVPPPSSFTSNTVDSKVTLDKESYENGPSNAEPTFSVNPIPATAGAGNPIKLAPGEKVPASSTYTTGNIHSNVTLDKESYEKSGSGVPVLPPVLNKTEEAEAAGAPIFGLGPITGNIIPESSLPMGSTGADLTSPHISSVAPQSTTTHLAGQQPLEARVPDVVKESQAEAHADPEASASTLAVREKSQVENELLQKVPTEPATSESGLLGKSEKGYLGAAAAAVTAGAAAAAGVAVAAKDQIFQQSAGGSTTAQLAGQQPIETKATVPEIVSESQQAAHASPEAASSPEAVREKSQVEKELLQKVPTESATSESGALGKSEKGYLGAAAAAVTGAGAAAYAATNNALGTSAKTTSAPSSSQPIESARVPEQVKESQIAAHASPEASASKDAVREKAQVEAELLQKVPTESATSESGTFGKSEKGVLGAAAAAVAGAGAAATGAAYAAKDKVVGTTATTSSSQPNGTVPGVVTESQHRAHASPEASANPEAIREKSAVEKELEQKVKPTDATGEPAPTASAALSSTAPAAATTDSGLVAGAASGRSLSPGNATPSSRDVSPMTRPGEPSAAIPRTETSTKSPSTPRKDGNRMSGIFGKKTPDSTSRNTTTTTATHEGSSSPVTSTIEAEKKANKRKSFFGKIKEKLKN